MRSVALGVYSRPALNLAPVTFLGRLEIYESIYCNHKTVV